MGRVAAAHAASRTAIKIVTPTRAVRLSSIVASFSRLPCRHRWPGTPLAYRNSGIRAITRTWDFRGLSQRTKMMNLPRGCAHGGARWGKCGDAQGPVTLRPAGGTRSAKPSISLQLHCFVLTKEHKEPTQDEKDHDSDGAGCRGVWTPQVQHAGFPTEEPGRIHPEEIANQLEVLLRSFPGY